MLGRVAVCQKILKGGCKAKKVGNHCSNCLVVCGKFSNSDKHFFCVVKDVKSTEQITNGMPK